MKPKDNNRSVRNGILYIALLLSIGFVMSLDRIPQNPEWSRFADHRSWLGIPNFGDIFSNLPFIVIGFMGLRFLFRPGEGKAFEFSWEKVAPMIFFTGVFLTGFGSAWFHLSPDNYRLVWDRLPMTLAFMGLFCQLISDHVSARAGYILAFPLAGLGMVSVIWWYWTEVTGTGDLRLYLLVQFTPLLAVVLILLLFPSRYSHGNMYWGVLLCYTLAKIFEHFDAGIFEALGFVSGHSLKHLFAAGSAGIIFQMLAHRQTSSSKRV